MEQKIYPLNIGEGEEQSLSTSRFKKKKKPTFKDWIKSRKWMVAGVIGICLLSIGAVMYSSGIGERFLGNIFGDTPPSFEIPTEDQNANPPSFEIPTEDQNAIPPGIEVDLAVEYDLEYSAGDGGDIEGPKSQKVKQGESGIEVKAVPKTGYSFVEWDDGLKTASRTDANVTRDLSLTAKFKKDDVVVTPPPPPPPPPTQPECNDGKDNDGDGDIDYPNDKGCSSLTDNTENSENNTKPPTGVEIKITNVSASKTKFNPDIHLVQFVYTLSNDANVKIEILDKDKKVVVTLVNESQKKGQSVANWNGTVENRLFGKKVPDGIYTYKITAIHSKYEDVKDTKEGSITVDSKEGTSGGGDFEDPNGGGAPQGGGQNNGGTLGSNTQNNNASIIAMQNARTGQTAGTGPGIIFYLLIPALAAPIIKLTKKS